MGSGAVEGIGAIKLGNGKCYTILREAQGPQRVIESSAEALHGKGGSKEWLTSTGASKGRN